MARLTCPRGGVRRALMIGSWDRRSLGLGYDARAPLPADLVIKCHAGDHILSYPNHWVVNMPQERRTVCNVFVSPLFD